MFFVKQKTAYEMRISDWSSDVCSSDLTVAPDQRHAGDPAERQADLQLFGNPGHPVRSGGAGRHPARTGGAQLWLCADAEGGEHRTAPAVPRRNGGPAGRRHDAGRARSEEHTSELKSLMRSSYADF